MFAMDDLPMTKLQQYKEQAAREISKKGYTPEAQALLENIKELEELDASDRKSAQDARSSTCPNRQSS